jgi:hypothetical protein
MKKLFPTIATRLSFVYILCARAKAYVLGALILLGELHQHTGPLGRR